MEITLYNINGKTTAYIADDPGRSIYLWSGYAVAYVYGDKVYGWNGKHLGWFIDGVVYDLAGLKVGFTSTECPVATLTELEKQAKYAKPAKQARNPAFTKPALGTGYSNQDLGQFLESGRLG